MSVQKKGWRDLPTGGLILEAGSSHTYKTGGWRTYRPVHNPQKCINCLACWIYCPDSSVIVTDGKFVGFDLDHCKGCGVCAYECPKKVRAITMTEEAEEAKD